MNAEHKPLRPSTVLPSLLTTGNLLCGFLSLILASQGAYRPAAALIFLGLLFDSLDGQMARWLGIATDFGIEYDSLADVITFGVAPAFLWGQLVLAPWGRAGWLSGFLFVVGAALRLARFNIQSNSSQPTDHFQGLPSPSAAGTLAGLSLLTTKTPLPSTVWIHWGALLLPPALAALMISTLPYRHFKHLPRDSFRISWFVGGFAAFVTLILVAPHWTLAITFGGYALSGPIGLLLPQRHPPAEET
ncbi:MAG TPA: CDP-diacylglycerol--serine O-phosphatidyltransferase [Anaerolineae bacterium]|nr:CDP-diacylglycerol--serine O-phosphatidyltransferase [Anaerolineae bacterium]HID83578.1 CDP-diacylglycerol--serine O-phosphatidyltransferase [Anaerolineales bacterium]